MPGIFLLLLVFFYKTMFKCCTKVNTRKGNILAITRCDFIEEVRKTFSVFRNDDCNKCRVASNVARLTVLQEGSLSRAVILSCDVVFFSAQASS